MRKIAFLLIAMVPILLSAKDTRKVSFGYFDSRLRVTYYVLKEDSSVLQGPYRITLNGKPLVLGYYKKGNRDSLWMEYNPKGILRVRGYYTENKRSGLWEFFDNDGQPEQKIDFDNDQILLYRSNLINQTFRIISDSDSTFSSLDRPPLYLGGISKINDFVAQEIQPPLHKANAKVTGSVYVELTIDSTGKSSHHHVLKGISSQCNSEALRVIKALPDFWFPGRLNGRSVTVNYVIPVIFEQELYKLRPAPASTVDYDQIFQDHEN